MLKKPNLNSGAGDPEVKALRSLVVMALDQIRSLHARAEALRFFAERSGAFSPDEYNRAYAEALETFDRNSTQALERALKDANAVARQRLLETHDSKPQ